MEYIKFELFYFVFHSVHELDETLTFRILLTDEEILSSNCMNIWNDISYLSFNIFCDDLK